MAKFNIGQRVVLDNFYGNHAYLKNGMAGTVKRVNANLGNRQTYEVNFDGDVVDTTVHEKFLKLGEENMKTVYRIVGPKGFTETLSEAQVKGLATAGILHHTETHVHDDELIKIYRPDNWTYSVKDFRSNRVSLEEQFPKDN